MIVSERPMRRVLTGAHPGVQLTQLRSDVKYLVRAQSVGTTGQKSRWTPSILCKPVTKCKFGG